MTKAKNKVLDGNGKAFDGEVPKPDKMKKVTYDLGKRCKHCDERVADKPLNKLFCDSLCRDSYFNKIKKSRLQELEQLKLKTDIQAQENKLRETVHQSEDVKKKKAEMQLHLNSLNISSEGLKVDVNYLNQINFDINLYDNLIESKKYPGKFIAQYGNYSCFWVSAFEIFILNQQDHLLWEL